MGSVKITDCRKNYGTVEVIHGISLDIRDKEFVVLVGPSGCGKSTLLRMIAGLEDITAGEICISDRVVNHVPPKDRDIAMVFQNYALYPHLTVAENMGFGMMLRNAPKAEIQRRVQEAAQILDLEGYLSRYPKQLSGGQRQRVAMGRAIVRNPQVFLFDEPLSNLDAKLRVQMRTEIKALHQKVQTTSVYVTHDQIEAMTLADRVVVLKDGNIMQVGAPLELYDQPENLFVAGFIGSPSMNLLPATLHRKDDHVSAIMPGGKALELTQGQAGQDGQDVIVGFRPEHLEITAVGETGSIPAHAQFTEPTGTETLVLTEVEGREISVLTRDRPKVSKNEEIALKVAPTNLHVFDLGTEQRL